MSKVLTQVIDGKIWQITINRPEVCNAVDGQTAQLLESAWLRFRDDDSLWVAVLTGAGDKAFCAGADLGALGTLGLPLNASDYARRRFVYSGMGYLGYTRQTDIFKPILAAVNGDALAGGLELACLADMRIVADHARFAVACRRWNVPLVDGGTQRLPRIVGLGRAMDLILTGRFIDAAEAFQMGLANRVVPCGKALEATLALARELCELPQGAMRTDKQAAVLGFGKPLEEGLRIEAELGQYQLRNPDLIEGALAFKQKRKPNFKQQD